MSFWELLMKAGSVNNRKKNMESMQFCIRLTAFFLLYSGFLKTWCAGNFWGQPWRKYQETFRLLAKRAPLTAEAMTLKKKKNHHHLHQQKPHVCFVIYPSIAWNPQNWTAKAGQSAALPTWLGPCSAWVWRVSLEASLEEMSEKLIPKKKINFRGAFAILPTLSHRLSSLLVLKRLWTQNSLPFCWGAPFASSANNL